MIVGAPTIWTVGHSTQSSAEFCDLLQHYQIEILVDVRRYPGSRRLPHFNQDALQRTLVGARVRYEHLVDLGGRRTPRPDSHNRRWQNAAFRGYADYMETAPFRAAVDELLKLAGAGRTAIMCAEVLWWRCHRSVLSDYLKSQGVQVLHILSLTKLQEHPYTSAAQIVKGRLSYESPAASEPATIKEGKLMISRFKIGDHVEWNSEAGRVRGTIRKCIESEMKFKGYIVHASPDEPQYLIKSDKTDHLAMHKGSALKKIQPRKNPK